MRLQPARTAGAVWVQQYSIKAEVIALIALTAQYLFLFQPEREQIGRDPHFFAVVLFVSSPYDLTVNKQRSINLLFSGMFRIERKIVSV